MKTQIKIKKSSSSLFWYKNLILESFLAEKIESGQFLVNIDDLTESQSLLIPVSGFVSGTIEAEDVEIKTPTAIDIKGNPVEITELENIVVICLAACDEYDERPYSDIDDLCNITDIDIKQMRGLLSSLTQKNVLYVDKDFFRKGDNTVFMFNSQRH